MLQDELLRIPEEDEDRLIAQKKKDLRLDALDDADAEEDEEEEESGPQPIKKTSVSLPLFEPVQENTYGKKERHLNWAGTTQE